MKRFNAIGRLGLRNVSGHTFYAKAIGPSSTVLDFGANLGVFSHHLASQYGCNVVAVEAHPGLCSSIERTVRVRALNYAIADKDGTALFYESCRADAGTTVGPKPNSTGRTVQVEARTLASLMAELGLEEVDLLKVDIEGAEIQLFESVDECNLNRVKQISVEFHDSVPIPNVSPFEVQRVVNKIRSFGFGGVPMKHHNFDWFFWNKRTLHMPPLAKAYLSMRRLAKARFAFTRRMR